MATGITFSTTDDLASGQRILITSAKEAFEPDAPDPDLVEVVRQGSGEKQTDVLIYGRLSDATQLAEANDMTQVEQLVTNSVSIAPVEHGIIATMSKTLKRRQSDTNIMATTGRQLGGSLRRRMAKDIIALYDGFSQSAPGAASTLDISHFRGAVAYLMTDNEAAYGPAQMPVHSALHAEQVSDIIADLTDPGAVISSRDGLSAQMLQRWWRGSDRLYGVQVFHSGNIARDGDDDAKGAIFSSMAIRLVMETNAEATEQTDESARITEHGLFQSGGEAEISDVWGAEVLSDAAATFA